MVSVELANRANAIVHCGAFSVTPFQVFDTVAPSSIFDVLVQQAYAPSTNGKATVTIQRLTASTSFKIYCLTESFQGVYMTASKMLSTHVTASTACCKTVKVAQAITSIYEDESAIDAFTVTVPALPSERLTVSISTSSASSTPHSKENVFYPSSFTFTNASTARSISVSLVAGATDQYTIDILLSGPSAAEFAVAGAASITVLAVSEEPPTPILVAAQFSSDGSEVEVSFSAATNRGGYVNSFPCDTVLSFEVVESARCQWKDSSTISVLDALSLVVNSSLALITDSGVKAQCTQTAGQCALWTTAPASQINVVAPAEATLPIVSLSVPPVLSSCADLVVDLTMSSGSGGRPWSPPVFSVVSEGDTGAILELLNSDTFRINPPTAIPAALLTVGRTYMISASMCNFLEACGSSSRAVQISPGSESLPITSIYGSQQRSTRTAESLLLTSASFTADCDGNTLVSGLEYEWSVYLDYVRLPDLVSQSQDPSKFRLAPFALTSLLNYEVQLKAVNSATGQHSTVAVTVYVEQSPLVARLSIGSYVSVAIGKSITVDASSSYDSSVAGLTGVAAGLQYAWECVQIKPVFSTTCPLDLGHSLQSVSLFAEQAIVLAADVRAINTTSRVAVTVYDATRSSSVSVEIGTQDSVAPLVTIVTSAQDTTSINTKLPLRLTGSVSAQSACTAEWGVDDTDISLEDAASSPVSWQLPSGSTRTLNLVLSANSLPQRSSLTFTLTCGASRGIVVVSTNGPPSPGSFSIDPTNGLELVTVFTLSTSSWVDVDLPLMFEFGLISGSSGLRMALQSTSLKAYASSTLPAGTSGRDYHADCYAKVFDSLNAFTESTQKVRVTEAVSINDQQAGITNQLAASRGSAGSMLRAISVGSSVLNNANCSLASVSLCTSLNRAICSSVEHTCGNCLEGYSGDAGPGNSLCVAAARDGRRLRVLDDADDADEVPPPFSRALASQECTMDSDCAGWEQCWAYPTDSAIKVCAVPLKQCAADCSGQGRCEFANANSGSVQQYCLADDPSCQARCRCFDGFGGVACGSTMEQLQQRRAVRKSLLDSLSQLVTLDDVTEQSVVAWANALSSVAQSSFELSLPMLQTLQGVAQQVLSTAIALPEVPFDELSALLSALDTAASAAWMVVLLVVAAQKNFK